LEQKKRRGAAFLGVFLWMLVKGVLLLLPMPWF
jgi:hypothetical protein